MEWLKVCVVFTILVGLETARGGRAKPTEVTALLGQGIVIPCSTRNPPKHPYKPRIYWQGTNPSRNKNPKDAEVMLAYNRGKVEDHVQEPLYRNRTRLFPDLLRHGDFSLQIDPVKIEDDQTRVAVQYEKSFENFEPICRTTIRVAARYRTPVVNFSCSPGAGLAEVTCATQGGFPQPTVSWRLQNCTQLSPQEETRTVKPDPHSGTFSVHLTLLLNASQGHTVTCVIYNPVLKETVNASVTIPGCEGNVSDPEPDPEHDLTNWALSVAVAVLLAVSVATCITVGRRCSFSGCRNQAPSDSPITGHDPERQELQGEGITVHPHSGEEQGVQSYMLKPVMES